jgi:hypothetical protein
MKNIQVIDGASNCAYDIYATTDEDFSAIFPAPGQDIQFIEDINDSTAIKQILARMWQHRIPKSEVNGIDGTLFYELTEKKQFYPNRQELDLTNGLGRSQR